MGKDGVAGEKLEDFHFFSPRLFLAKESAKVEWVFFFRYRGSLSWEMNNTLETHHTAPHRVIPTHAFATKDIILSKRRVVIFTFLEKKIWELTFYTSWWHWHISKMTPFPTTVWSDTRMRGSSTPLKRIDTWHLHTLLRCTLHESPLILFRL